MVRGITRRSALAAGLGAVAGGLATRALQPALPGVQGVATLAPSPASATLLNDASLLSATPVNRHILLGEAAPAAEIARLRAELAAAAAEGRAVNIGAARHSMGGQAIPRDGTAITFAGAGLGGGAAVALDSRTGIYRAHAGARWSQVIAALDPAGWGPRVMQSNHDFGLAATFSVNAHGWPCPMPPMGSTVRGVTMMLADGSILPCSRTENPALFAAAMGGYGLIGLILEMEIEASPNARLLPHFATLPAAEFAAAFVQAMRDPTIRMAYGRLNVDRDRFFEDALLVTYAPAPDQTALPPAEGSGFASRAAARLYRAQLGHEGWKRRRWEVETRLNPALSGGAVTRNSLMNEPVATLDDGRPERTDILHEYFVAPERFGEFLDLCRAVLPQSYQEMLNVTLRYVAADADSLLAFAPAPRIAAVLSFSQEMTLRAEADMARMTAAMVEGMLAIGGSYYLPYRPHATPAQFLRAYPRAAEFAELKRRTDPRLTLRNALWERYLAPL